MKNLMKEQLPKHIMNLFEVVAVTANELAMSVYVVGGFVRDLLIGIENFDLDIWSCTTFFNPVRRHPCSSSLSQKLGLLF